MKKIIKINQWYAKNSSHTCPPTSPRAVIGKGVVPMAATKSLVILRRFQGSQPHRGRSGVCKLGTRKHLVRYLELVRFLCAYPVVGNTCPLRSHYETSQETNICGVQFLTPKPPTSG